MYIKKVDLTSDKFSEHKIDIQISYSELVKISNAIAKREIKDDSDALLRWQFYALHDFCNSRGFQNDFAPGHIWPAIMAELKKAKAKNKKK